LEAAISLYLDENLSPKIAAQLRRRGIQVVTAHELGTLGDTDENHLKRALEMGCVFCTHDIDYLIMVSEGIQHAGIVFGIQEKHSIGDWVKGLELICSVYSPDDMKNHVEYL
jgi:hypothetical protein